MGLDDLAADCAADGVYEFLLAATPLPITARRGRRGGADRDEVAWFKKFILNQQAHIRC